MSPLTDTAARRFDSIQLCRAGAAWLVVLYHLATLGDHRWSTVAGQPTVLRVFESFGFAGVDLFFVISGVVMALTCWRRLGERRHAAPFLRRRAARIYPLYWLCTLAVLAIAWGAPQLVPAQETDPWFILKSLALWPQREMPVVTVGWTLTYEVCFYLAFAGLIVLPRRWFVLALALWTSAIVATLGADPATQRLLEVPAVFPPLAPLALEFIGGCLLGAAASQRLAGAPRETGQFRHPEVRRGVRHADLRPDVSADLDVTGSNEPTPASIAAADPGSPLPAPRVMLALGFILFFVFGTGTTYAAEGELASEWLRIGTFGVGSALLVYGALGCELAGAKPPPRALTFWGDASYSLYLTHGYVIQGLGLLLPASLGAERFAVNLALTLTLLAACAAVAALVHLVLERPLLAWARRLHVRGQVHAEDPANSASITVAQP